MSIICTGNESINPNWHELREQEKCSSFAPPRSTFYKTQWAWQGVKLTRLMSIFTYHQKSLEIFEKNSADKIWSKKDKRIKVSPPVPNKRANNNFKKNYVAVGYPVLCTLVFTQVLLDQYAPLAKYEIEVKKYICLHH